MKRLISIVLVLMVALMAVDASAKKPLKAKCKKDHLVNQPYRVLSVLPINATSIHITAGDAYDETGAVVPGYYEFATVGYETEQYPFGMLFGSSIYEILDQNVRNLIPNSSYMVRIKSNDLCRNEAWSDWFYFITPSAALDSEAPTVLDLRMTYKVSHTIVLTAEDNEGIKEVEFYFNDTFLMLSVPYQKLRQYEDKTYKCADYDKALEGQFGTVTVRIRDWNGNVTEHSIQAEM